jgi:hypothetical protein
VGGLCESFGGVTEAGSGAAGALPQPTAAAKRQLNARAPRSTTAAYSKQPCRVPSGHGLYKTHRLAQDRLGDVDSAG